MRGIKLIFGFMFLLLVTSCNSSDDVSKYKDGIYSATTTGFGGVIEVEMEISEGKILSLDVLNHSESEGYGKDAIPVLVENIKTNNGVNIDKVAGSTVTSDAMIDVVSKLLDEASGDLVQNTGAMKDGKYTTKAHGQESYVHVATTILNNEIKDVHVLTHHETVGIGTYAIERIPSKIVENQSIEVDSVSGATLTSNAIKRAVSEAITIAGGNLSDFQIAEAKSTEEVKDEEVTVDVVIMGAGTAGLVSANKLAEKGLNVMVFEKMDIPGGAMSTTYSGVLSFGSDRELEYTRQTMEQLDAKFDSYIDYYNKTVVKENALNDGFPYWVQILENSGEFVNWLDDIGVGFLTMNDHLGSTPYMAPGAYQGGVGYAMEYLVDRAVKDGVKIQYATPVVDLIQDEKGKIVGVKALGEDGKNWTVHADAVLIASGGFGNNKALLAEYYPEYSKYVFNTTAGSDGDGLVLAMNYGAGIDSMGRKLGAFMSTYDTKYELAFMHYTTPGIIVNIEGNNIGNIMSGNHSVLGAAKLDEKNGDTFYYVIDEAARLSTKKSNYDGLSYNVSYEPIFETGQAVYYSSVEEASKELNLPNLQASIDANNKASMSGEKDEFGRNNCPYIDTTNGLYMLRVDPTFYVTTGGLSCDLDGRILDTNGEIIEGLYGAGDVLGSLEEKDGLKYGYGFDSALIFGYVVADNIAEDIK